MDGLKQQIDGIGERIGKFSFNQKVLLGALLGAGVISVVIFSFWLRQEEMSVLFTNLTPEDAALALEELDKQNVPADLDNGGTTVLVPEAMVHKLRVNLAAKGIPSSGTVGFEIFDGSQYGLTEFLQNVNFKRALEGELTKSIESLSGIQSARVHLVLPKSSIFKKLQTAATASVVVGLARGAVLGENQITGIQSLVAGSVEDLETINVTVIDQRGKVLSAPYDQDDGGRSEHQLALKKEVEDYLAGKAQTMLSEVLGQGRSIVRVDATLNFEKIDTEREVFDPEATVVRSEEVQESSDPTTGGSQEASVTNYEINRTVERIVGDTGGVKTLSVAVFVDGKYEAPSESEDPAYIPLSEEEMGQIRRVVQTAVGLSSERGDVIEVVNMQFNGQGSDFEPLGSGGGGTDWMGYLTQYGGRVLLFLLAGILLLNLKRNLGHLVGEAVPAGARGAGGSGAGGGGRPAGGRERLNLGAIPADGRAMEEDVKEYAAENPQKVAEVLQTWLAEEE